MKRFRGRDDANMVVLEVLVVALLVLGSIVFVLTFDSSTSGTEETRSRLEVVAGDILTVLSERTTGKDAFRGSYLNEVVVEAIHGDPDRLAFRVDKLLPPGAGFQLQLSNGVDARVLHAQEEPGGETVSASRPLAPGWGYTVLVPDFQVYSTSPGTPMNLTGVPVRRSNVLDPGVATPAVNFTNGHAALLDGPGPAPELVSNGSIPPDDGTGSGYAVSGALRAQANWTLGSSALPGSHGYTVSSEDVVADTHTEARRGLNGSSLSASPATAEPGDTVTITWDLSQVALEVDEDLASGTTPSVNVSVLEPVQGLGTPSNWSVLRSWTGRGDTGSVDLEVPRSTLYGTHVVLAELHYTLDDGAGGTVEQTARLVTTFDAGLPGGSVPPDPMYQLSLTTWYSDW